MFERFRASLSRWIAPNRTRLSKFGSVRMYQSARSSRLTSGFGVGNTSADTELVTSLTALRSRSRALVRDASYAKRARKLVVDNVIGTGIGMQAQVKGTRGEMRKPLNDEIESLWAMWSRAEYCHTGGRLDFASFERAVMAEVFEAGEVFIRKHYQSFGGSPVPFALEIIEAERIADELYSPGVAKGAEVRMGIEVDEFFRPVAYHIRKRHPSEFQFAPAVADFVERVPAGQVIHVALVDRWPQTRGEPWLHTAARRMNDMDGYSEAEIVRARAQATTVGAIETPESAASFGEEQDDGTVEMELESGVLKRLNPGEKLTALSPTAPNPALEPFMRAMLREVASGIGVSYESLSRDYSQSNYSSSRLALLDDRDAWKHLQQWIIRTVRMPIHREWMQQAVAARALSIPPDQYFLDPEKWNSVRFKPRGWSWIDPTKEVEAYIMAIKAGFTTVSDVIASTGGGLDLEDVLEQRKNELQAMDEADLVFETSPEFYAKEEQEPSPPAEESDDTEEPPPMRFQLVR